MWLGFASAQLKVAMACAAIGFLGPARTLGATTMMTSEGAKLGIPQGELSGDRCACCLKLCSGAGGSLWKCPTHLKHEPRVHVALPASHTAPT